MRLLLLSGKGGVGKTSIAAATGLRLSKLGIPTLVMSVDPAHSIADSFDVEGGLFQRQTNDPYQVDANLWIHEINIQKEIRDHWIEISSYVTSLLRTSGMGDVEAEELAVIPGMEELSALMYVNQFRRERRYEVIVLDCAPTAESIRFVSLPKTIAWYMKHFFSFERGLYKAARPLIGHFTPVELPKDSYFANIEQLVDRLDGVDEVLGDPKITSVRLVTNPEKMVLRETQRAFVYFSLHGLTVDRIIVNRVLPEAISGAWFHQWRASQTQILTEIDEFFSPIQVTRVPLFRHEVMGRERIEELADALYPNMENPAEVTRTEATYTFGQTNSHYHIRLRLPFAAKGEVQIFKKRDELVVEIGTLRRHVMLPTFLTALTPARARLEDEFLTVEFDES